MTTLAVMQRYAERVADKLGLGEGSRPVLRWFGGVAGDRLGRSYAHCHIRDPRLPRGTICIGRGRSENDGGRWRRLVAHEVTHLAVQNHNAPGFLKRLRSLGVGTERDRRRLIAVAALRHRHVWGYAPPYHASGAPLTRTCRLCHEVQEATAITWRKKP